MPAQLLGQSLTIFSCLFVFLLITIQFINLSAKIKIKTFKKNIIKHVLSYWELKNSYQLLMKTDEYTTKYRSTANELRLVSWCCEPSLGFSDGALYYVGVLTVRPLLQRLWVRFLASEHLDAPSNARLQGGQGPHIYIYIYLYDYII